MQRTFAVLIAVSMTISACGTSPSIWGVASTPTPYSSQTASLVDPFSFQDEPIIFPTSTIPPFIATDNAATPEAQPTENSAAQTEPTLTPPPPLNDAAPFLYYAQSGDMLSAVA